MLLHARRVRHRLVVQQHEVDGEAFQVPVFVRGQQLPQQAAIVDVVDAREQDRPIARDAEPPQARQRQRVRLQRSLRRPQRHVVVEQRVRELLVQVRLAVVDAEVMQLHLRVRPCERRRAVVGGGIVILVGEPEDVLVRRRDHRREGDLRRRARRDLHAHAQARDRVQHRAGEIGQRASFGHRDRRVHGPSAADEARAVGLELDARRRVAGDHVRTEELAVGGRTRSAREDQARNLRHELAADEEIGERRMREVGRGWRQRDLRIGRDLDLARPRADVAQRQAADLRVVFRGHDHFEHRLDVAVLADDADAVLVERDVVARGLDADRLIPGRPHAAVARVAQINEAAVVVARRVLAPARDADVAPLAVAGAGRRQHHRIAAVRHQLRRRPRQMRRMQPLLERQPAVVDQRRFLLVGARQGDRRIAVPCFLQQDSRRADQRLAMELAAQRRRRAARSRATRASCPGDAPCRRERSRRRPSPAPAGA